MGRVLGAVAGSAALLLTTAATATAAPTVGSIGFSPSKTVAGGTITAGGKVANRGDDAETVVVRLGLRADGRTRAVGLTRVRARAHNKTRFQVKAGIPATFEPGRYDVVACVGRACRTATGRLLVSGPERPPVTAPAQAPSETAPVAPPAPPARPAPSPFSPGARSGGDVLFPQIGNGGYDAQHYDLDLAYDPGTQELSGEATMTAQATQGLSQFSMDFQGMTVASVTVNGAAATFSRELPAAASPNAENIASKLVITPAAGIPTGTTFAVTVTYSGHPDTVIDPDGSSEGWFPTAGGGVVVCQPIGCQAVYPQNNVPYDKATFDTTITVPDGLSGIGNGELVSRTSSAGLTTWRWHMGKPISTYLTTASVGDYTLTEATDGRGRPIYDFVDNAFSPADKAFAATRLAEAPSVIDFLSSLYGPYPFDSYGAIVADAPTVGYALEVATRPFYPGALISSTTQAHELAHQWYGNSLTYAQIRDMWIQEGMAQWLEWYWYNQVRGGDTTQEEFDALYDDPGTDWSLPPALPTADTIFDAQVYERGAMTWDGLRQILGDNEFFDLVAAVYDHVRYGSITTAQYIAFVEQFTGRDLDQFFQDWLYTPGRPPLPSTYA